MTRKKIIIGAGVAVLAAIAAVTPYLAGIKAEKSLRADHEILAQELVFPGLEITLASYQRGYLGAEAVTAITFTPEAKEAKPIRLELHHHISHLPNLLHLALASATSELVLPPELQAQADKFLNGQPPLTVKSYVRFSGAQAVAISSPAFKTTLEDKTTTVEWKGIEGNGTQNRDADTLTNEIAVPGIAVRNPAGDFLLDGMHYQSAMKRGSYGLWYGTSEASLKSLQFDTRPPSESRKIAFNDLRMTSEQKEEGAVTNGNVIFQFGKSNVDDLLLDSGVYDFEYRNFDTKTLSDIQASVKEAYAGSDEARLGAAILSSIPSLLKARPEINIRRLEMKSSQGSFSGKFHLAFTGEWRDEMMENPTAILPMLDADLDITITKSLLVSLGRSQMRSSIAAMADMQGEELSAEEIDAMAKERATQQLEVLAANEYLLEKGDSYTTRIHFEKGQLSINGKAANELLGPPAR